MRHVSRARKAFVAPLHAQRARGNFYFACASTDGVAVDVFTASTPAPATWAESRKRINVVGRVSEWQDAVRRDRPKPPEVAVACRCPERK